MAAVIATETTIVHDDVLNIDRQVIIGQPVPPDLIDAYNAKVSGDAPDTSVVDDLEALDLDDLKARAEGLDVMGTGQGGRVLKADLIQAIKARQAAE